MRISITYTGPNPQRVQYVLGFLQGHPYTPRNVYLNFNEWMEADMVLEYAKQFVPLTDEKYRYIPAQERLMLSTKETINWVANPYNHQGQTLYSVEPDLSTGTFFSNQIFGFDIIETLYFHLTRHEEYFASPKRKDQWSMLHEKFHFLVRNELYHVPVVDDIVYAFWESLGIAPEPVKPSLTITHDIDVLRKFDSKTKSLKAMAGVLFRSKSIKNTKAIIQLQQKVKNGQIKDPYDTFSQLFVEGNHNKIAYFMAARKGKNDDGYNPKSQEGINAIRLAQSRGYEIGIHPSYDTYQDYEKITSEKQQLEQAANEKIRSGRQHFLRFDFSETITALTDSGIYEDSTLGYQRLVGFRCGTQFPFLMFDLRRNRVSRLVQNPMVLMDGALLHQHDGDAKQALLWLQDFLSKAPDHLNINFHNTIFDPTRYDREIMWEIYHTIINKYSS